MSSAEVNICSDSSEVATSICSYLEQIAEMTIAEKDKFVIGVSGGSVATYLNEELPKIQTDWSKWYVFLCDERVVAKDDPECTYTLFKDGLLSQVPIPEENLFGIEDPDAPLEDIIASYTEALRNHASNPVAPDVVVLGMGPDGHTASLFPGHETLLDSNIIIGETDSPKPPSQRITMSLKTLNSASSAIFICCGEGKAETVAEILNEHDETGDILPAGLVNPQNGLLSWYLDIGAARLLKPPVISVHQKRTIDAAYAFKEMI